eukprot:TRINITY_DN1026_c0_g1_i2.p1 TRINITY_DN1026_c0_g1~~TRINITY_DN1026_c0_g1_i2.p1  ORF type:complete len:232 (-),score=64.42 TRINITY_DN1026_c0_g1_i2:82-777(-)
MVAAKMLFLLMPVALALEQELALVQLQAEKLLNDGSGMTDGSEENPIDVLSHAKDAMKAAVQRALGHDTTKEHTVVKTTVNASKKHAVASKPNASQKHVVAPKANVSQKQVVAPKANVSQKQVPTQAVSFHLKDSNTEYGDRIVVVGDDDQFGNWEPTMGMDLLTDEDTFPEWKLDRVQVAFPKATLEYKFVVLKTNGTVEWEQFGVETNRKLHKTTDAFQLVHAAYGKLA